MAVFGHYTPHSIGARVQSLKCEATLGYCNHNSSRPYKVYAWKVIPKVVQFFQVKNIPIMKQNDPNVLI